MKEFQHFETTPRRGRELMESPRKPTALGLDFAGVSRPAEDLLNGDVFLCALYEHYQNSSIYQCGPPTPAVDSNQSRRDISTQARWALLGPLEHDAVYRRL